jgi:type II secretory pathway pseudopilin PulG
MTRHQYGFTLIEMAVAGFIIVLLLGSILVPLGTQVEQRQLQDTQKYLEDIKEALIGFAVANGRLPCPATATSAGVESYVGAVGASACTSNFQGFLPAATLGIMPVDAQGFAVDPWGNRVRYAVTAWTPTAPPCNPTTPPFTTSGGMSAYFSCPLSPNLLVCSTATGITASSCAAGTALTCSGVPVVIYSTGKNGGSGGTGLDEAANPNPNSANNDRVFVFHAPRPSTAPNGEFDDIMTWLSPNVLYNRMIAAGKLP